MREKINLNDNIKNILIKMSEGNPGGLRVLIELLNNKMGFIYLLGLDDMNIRGWQIWVGYKDYCKSDLNKFIEAIHNRSSKMVELINQSGMRNGSPERAVIGGFSFNR